MARPPPFTLLQLESRSHAAAKLSHRSCGSPESAGVIVGCPVLSKQPERGLLCGFSFYNSQLCDSSDVSFSNQRI